MSGKLALMLGISKQAVAKWSNVPAHQIIAVERATGVPAWRRCGRTSIGAAMTARVERYLQLELTWRLKAHPVVRSRPNGSSAGPLRERAHDGRATSFTV